MQRYKLLGKKTPIDVNERRLVALEREQKFLRKIGKGNWEQGLRENNIDLAVNFAVIQYLDVFEVDDLNRRLNVGVDQSLDYFCGDWWKNSTTDSTYLDKSQPNHSLIWSNPYLHAAFLCGLTQRWSDLQRISEWVDESVCPEITFDAIDDEFVVFLIYIASTLRSRPLPAHEALRQAVERGRPKRPRLLLKAFQSATEDDQATFDHAIIESLKHCEKYEVEDVGNLNYWVGIPQSFICAIAERNGLTVPILPLHLDILTVRRSAIRLEPC